MPTVQKLAVHLPWGNYWCAFVENVTAAATHKLVPVCVCKEASMCLSLKVGSSSLCAVNSAYVLLVAIARMDSTRFGSQNTAISQ